MNKSETKIEEEIKKIKEEKVIDFFLTNYLEEEGAIKFIKINGKKEFIRVALDFLINEAKVNENILRKEMSIYIKRIISIEEFEMMKNWGVC